MKFAAFFMLCILAVTADAGNWQCKNDLEIRCAAGHCQAETADGFTPMSVNFDDSGKISVCAYSGCWEGTAEVFESGDFLSLHGSNLKFSTADSRASVAITLDRNDGVAFLKVGEFAQPLICAPPDSANNDAAEFIPAGWKLEDSVTGELNGDSLPDSVIQIIKNDSEEDYNRSLIILLGTKGGGFIKAAEAQKIIRCSICGGMLGGGPAGVKIEKGVLIISQMYGSREASDYLHRFRYEPETGKFLLIGEDVTNFDRATGESETTSTNYLTGKRAVSKTSVNPTTGKETVKQTTQAVKIARKVIEDIDYADY